ncbi:hypothetical protein DFH11DRAFT_1730995 [Phellopilus nigrolimitatus]|nr:hypothetical protein DFH11DRAFT_1730995 [Phellopilus nigrolimitatus]
MVTVVFTNKGAADIDVSFTDENGKKVKITVSPDENKSQTMKENYTYNISFVKQGLEKKKGFTFVVDTVLDVNTIFT